MNENIIETAILGECLESVVDYRGKTPPKSPCGIPTITAANVKSGRIDMSTVSYVSEKTYWEWSTRGFPEASDVLITTEAPVGEVAPFPGDQTYLITRRVFAMRGKKEVLDNAYLLYTCLSSIVQDELQSRIRGSTVPRVLKTDILGLQIPLPPIGEQKAIAHILGTLDDKIELNRKTNETLEAMAKALFKSWFVDFDPVRAKAEGRPTGLPAEISDLFPDSFEDSELGEIPRDWSVSNLSKISTLMIGGDWGGDPTPETAPVPCLRGVDIHNLRVNGKSKTPLRGVSIESISKRRPSACDLLVEGSGKCGRSIACGEYLSSLLGGDYVYSNFCKRLRMNTSDQSLFVEHLLNQMVASGEMGDYVTGTAMPNLDIHGLMRSKTFALPPEGLLSAFAEMKRGQYNCLLSGENPCLEQIRDALLPKLISGELRIPDAERMLEEVGV